MPDTLTAQQLITLTEAQVTSLGSPQRGEAWIRLIAPGQGATAFYPEEVLQRDGPTVFREGTQMYWNHPTDSERWERPERSLDDLAGVMLTDAIWRDGDEAGLYAQVRVFSPYFQTLQEVAQYIGVSVRVIGTVTPSDINGLPVVDSLEKAESVDFVTQPGAGGRILELFESARKTPPNTEKEDEMATLQELQEAVNKLQQTQGEQTKQLEEAVKAKEAAETAFQEATKDRDRMREQVAHSQATQLIATALQEAELPKITVDRLNKSIIGTIKLTEAGALDSDALNKTLEESIKAEKEYIEQLGAQSNVRGVGANSMQSGNSPAAVEMLTESFKELGLSEDMAKIAAAR